MSSDYNLNKRLAQRDTTIQPNKGIVESVLPEEEALLLDSNSSFGKNRRIVGHPYFGVNSWIRVMPEIGTQVLTLDKGDEIGEAIIGYSANSMVRRHRDGRTEKLLLRILNPGEIELMSAGRAYVFLGSGGDLELRGGMIRTDLLQTEQEHVSVSPTYVRKLHLAPPSEVEFQERFGVVKRPDQQLPSAFQKYIRRPPSPTTLANYSATAANAALLGQVPPPPQDFAFEYSRWLANSDRSPLVSLQEGHVYDKAGTEKKHSSTNKALRYERIFTDFSGLTNTTIQLDQELNVGYNNTSPYTREFKMNLGLNTTLDVTSDQQKFTVVKTGNQSYGISLTVSSPKVNIKSPMVGFGDNPIIPIMLAGPTVNAVLTPLLSALQTFFQLYGADVPIASISPQTVVSANVVAGTVVSVLGQLQSCVSTQVLASG